ncbi:DegT/DnrJ/EryC1/StrS family aminotransferase [Saccharopolyspora phatthalungensis]|uniref:dTDP-4-amino-4,6-dideoxygalactose transaminase n=1 Tax=Saccharopolyspora phatthalungensis TaxID=664693 RepID=A0A840Q8Y6_9PSEU|nr:DegT/DnrJ/EryC1/StrS family aminotransferase [Saccharopolyspora phatthalungensis]MBB5157224.1 dTDP-4-amino-4,6-dideoxygalactose transaminase [Saccharopolyspora phatthalungensis]
MLIPIPFYSCADSVRRNWESLERRVRAVADSGRFTSGPMVAELETAIAAYTGAKHAVACNNGTDALILMLKAAGIGPGDEVIVPAYTFFATVSSVLRVGAEPVIVDVLPGSYAMDPERAAAAIGPRTKAIMPAHMFSQTADLVALTELAAQHGLRLLEDSAEAIGMWVNGRHAGLWGRAGVLSFFPTKTLGGIGDAGMLITDDAELAAEVRRRRCHGQATDGAYVYEVLGWNSRCDELQAAVLLSRLETLDAEIERRAALAARYTERLAAVVDTPWLAPAKSPSNQVWYVYLIESDRRDALVEHLDAHGVGTEVYYPRSLSEQPALRDLPGASLPTPVATVASRRAVGLPLYPDLTDAQVDRVCALITDFHQGGTR